MRDLAIFGVGGFGREVLTLVQSLKDYNIVGFFDDGYPKGTPVNGFVTLGGIDDLNSWPTELALVVAIGTPRIKKIIVDKITSPLIYFPTVIHPSVIIGDKERVNVGRGCIICAGCLITTDIEIDDFVILNLGCTVGHDTVIGEHASFMPSVNISGEVRIGNGVYVGTGAKIINQLEIGPNSIIGAGAVVTKTIPSNSTAVGVPAKVIKGITE